MGQTSAQRQAKWQRQHPELARERSRAAQQKRRDSLKESAKSPIITWPDPPADPAGALADWARSTLRIPFGHRNAGERLELPEYLVDFFRDALQEGCHESLNCVSRKNGKSSGAAILILGHIAESGPLRRPGLRFGVASLSRQKAGELRLLMEDISTASGLENIRFWRRSSPAITSACGTVDIMAADANSGASSGFDWVILDEPGLMAEKHRPLIASLRSSVSARDGKFMSLSVRGSGPFVEEILARRGESGLAIHLHAAPEGCALDDPEAHKLANPGLGIIKSYSYMEKQATRAISTPADQSFFRAHDLNQKQDPSKEMVCSPDDWAACVVPADKLPARSGPCFLGFDAGGSSSMTAASIWFPESKRLEIYAAFPSDPEFDRPRHG